MKAKITDARLYLKTYKELEQGQLFLYEGILYIKTDIEKDEFILAVRLGNGGFAAFVEDTRVETVDAEIRYF